MALNIKDERTHELVKELAEITGVSQTAAVRDAVERELRRRRRVEAVEDWLVIIKETSKMMGDLGTHNMDKLLYDENGLPK